MRAVSARRGRRGLPGGSFAGDTLRRSRRLFRRRRRSRRWVRWRGLLLAGLVVALASGMVWMALFSSVFAVRAVDVEGADLLSEGQVRALAGVPEGEPLARVDVQAVEGRLRALAPVYSVRVTRSWPDRIVVRLVERSAVATVHIGPDLRGIDAEGVVFRTFDARPRGLPLIEARADVGDEAIREGAGVVTALPGPLRERVDRIEVRSVDHISLRLRGDSVVLWGSAERSDDKARVLSALLAARPDVRRYDVSTPGRPTTRG